MPISGNRRWGTCEVTRESRQKQRRKSRMNTTLHGAQLSRRCFSKLAAGTVMYLAGGSLMYSAELPEEFRGSVAHRLASELPSFDGVLVFDDAVCRAMASDFGHYIHHHPIGVL